MTTALEEFVRRMPKVELHLHLEGSLRRGTLLELAKERRVELPADDEEGLAQWFVFEHYRDFIPVYVACSRCLRDPEQFQRVVLELMEDQARQNVVYTEAHLTISTHRHHGANVEEVRQAVWEAAREGEKRFETRLRFIPDIVRNVGPEVGEETLEWALEGRHEGVVALGLSGSEDRFPVGPFAFHFRTARQEGLPVVAHAGEHAGPESIRDVLACCEPRRLGHGIRAIDDESLVRELAASRLPLEICPSSNLSLGAVERLQEHPVAALREAGVGITVGSDDPLFFECDLTSELLLLHRTFGYDAGDLAGFSLAAVEHALLPSEERETWQIAFVEQFSRLGDELFGIPIRARRRSKENRDDV